MALHWPTFFTRLGSAIVFCAVMLTGLLWNDWSYLLLVNLIKTLCLREYFMLIRKIDTGNYWPAWLSIITQLISILSLWFLSPVFVGLHTMQVLIMYPFIVLLVCILSKKTTLIPALHTFGGLVYITAPMMMLYHIGMIDRSIPIALILMLWTNDTMAYLVGSFIGKTPFSTISPKKTWEGTIGGAILTMAAAGIWGYYSGTYHMIDWMALALCAAVAGTAGDLLESKLKRLANVKDSGTLMPGHGGALDRFDSLLIATPFAFVYAYYFML